jgi:2-hydroxychromene-2-carboxylate isomerase
LPEDQVTKPLKIEIYYDYSCPYVHAAALWIKDVKEALGPNLEINWRCFPLEQVNSAEGPEWKLWEQPLDYVSRGRMAFHGAIAAKQQGEDAFLHYHYLLLDAKHVDGKNHGQRKVIMEVARRADLDVVSFESALEDASLLATIGVDYEHGLNGFGVFGTPTFIFPGGEAAYLKMRRFAE